MAEDYSALGTGIGSAAGGIAGSFIPGVGTAIGSAAGGALGGAIGGAFGRQKTSETPTQAKQRMLVDELLASLHGEGPYSNLFTANEEDFERRFAEPARNRFRSQAAPQIQQSYIAGGQQRSTGLDDTLARAGINIEDLINQSYMDYVQSAQKRQAKAIGSVLGAGAGTSPYDQSYGEAAMQGLSGYLTAPEFRKDIGNILSSFTDKKQGTPQEDKFPDQRKGFEHDRSYLNVNLGDFS